METTNKQDLVTVAFAPVCTDDGRFGLGARRAQPTRLLASANLRQLRSTAWGSR